MKIYNKDELLNMSNEKELLQSIFDKILFKELAIDTDLNYINSYLDKDYELQELGEISEYFDSEILYRVVGKKSYYILNINNKYNIVFDKITYDEPAMAVGILIILENIIKN